MHMGNSHRHENFKDTEALLGRYDIFGQKRKGRGGISENG